jgi:hypothetical protein
MIELKRQQMAAKNGTRTLLLYYHLFVLNTKRNAAISSSDVGEVIAVAASQVNLLLLPIIGKLTTNKGSHD